MQYKHGLETALFEEFQIKITHVATQRNVSFYAFLTSFSDSFKGNFKTQTVYGRMDPIVNYQGTTRKISLAFTVPAYSLENGKENFDNLQELIRFQYPTYITNKTTITQTQKTQPAPISGGPAIGKTPIKPPAAGAPNDVAAAAGAFLPDFLKKTIDGLTTDAGGGGGGTGQQVSGLAAPPICSVRFNNLINYYDEDLYGYFDGVDFNPTNDTGYFLPNGKIIPKEFKISLTFNVLHTSEIGWNANTNNWIFPQKAVKDIETSFPYNITTPKKV